MDRHAGPSGVQEPPGSPGAAVPRVRGCCARSGGGAQSAIALDGRRPLHGRVVIEPGSTSESGFTFIGETVLHEGYVISVAQGEFETPEGDRITRDIVHHPGAVAVVAIDGDEVILVRQYRAALHIDLLEIPAGKRDVAGEAPELTAARELEEEVGLRPLELELLTGFHNSVGFCDEYVHVFLATAFEPVETAHDGPEEAHMTIEWWPLEDAIAATSDGRITDSKTQIGILAAARRLGR
ncbi:MAG: NUDIX domain-containing protein [Actinobacteria bacterium]|nr:NUDIX domain-containing protein [Actinomycetota bacterium]